MKLPTDISGQELVRALLRVEENGRKTGQTHFPMGSISVRNFYFDGTQSDLDRDLGVYLELARSSQKKRGEAGNGRAPALPLMPWPLAGNAR